MSSIATTVDCGGQQHPVVWQDGEVLTPRHTHAERERVVAALGETTCTCVDVADAWSRHRDDPAVLTVLTRGPGELAGGERALSQSAGRRGGSHRAVMFARQGGGPGAQDEDRSDDFELLYGLGPALGARLVAAVTERCLAQVGAGDVAALPALRVSLASRAGLALGLWTSGARPVRVEVAGPGDDPSLRADGDDVVAVLGLSWVASVWGRGLATVGDRFVIDARDGEPGEIRLSSVGPDLGAVSTITVRFD